MASLNDSATSPPATEAEGRASSPVDLHPTDIKRPTEEKVPDSLDLSNGVVSAPVPSTMFDSGLGILPFRFFDLPLELRRIICQASIEMEYESRDVLNPNGFRYMERKGCAGVLQTLPPLRIPSIMNTCKELQMECQPYYFAIPRDFGHRLLHAEGENPLLAWIARVNPEHLRYITRARFSQDFFIGPCHDCVVVTLVARQFPKGYIKITSGCGESDKICAEEALQKLDSHLKFESKHSWKDDDFWKYHGAEEYEETWNIEGIYQTKNLITAVEELVDILKRFPERHR